MAQKKANFSKFQQRMLFQKTRRKPPKRTLRLALKISNIANAGDTKYPLFLCNTQDQHKL